MKNTLNERLRMARRLRGLSMDDLVKLMNGAISKQSISKYERGLSAPRPHHYKLLMEVLGITEDYFERKTVTFSHVSYRYKGDITTNQKERLECLAKEIIERYVEIEGILNIYPEFKNPLNRLPSLYDVEKIAMQLREKWQLGVHPIPSVTCLLETYGIMVVEVAFESTNLLGFSALIEKKRPVIVINTQANSTTERQRFTLLHELAHILLFSRKMGHHLDADEERLCERFAGALLCPSSVLYRELGEHRTTFALNELISIRERYGISIAAIVHCCKDIGIISEQYYNYVYDNYINLNRMESGWGNYPIPEHTDRFGRLIQRALAEEIVTKEEFGKFTEQLTSSTSKNKTIWD